MLVLDVQPLAQSFRANLNAADGIAAEREEVVVDADTFQIQHFGPYRAQCLFDQRPRWNVKLIDVGADFVRRWERFTIDFAASREWKSFKLDEAGGHHVMRELSLGEAAKFADGSSSFLLEHDIGD